MFDVMYSLKLCRGLFQLCGDWNSFSCDQLLHLFLDILRVA